VDRIRGDVVSASRHGDAVIQERLAHGGQLRATLATIRLLHVVAIQTDLDVLEAGLPVRVVEVREVAAFHAVLVLTPRVLGDDGRPVRHGGGAVADQFADRGLSDSRLHVGVELVDLHLLVAEQDFRVALDGLTGSHLHFDRVFRHAADVRDDVVEEVDLDPVDRAADRGIGVRDFLGRFGRSQFRSRSQVDATLEHVDRVGPHANWEHPGTRGVLDDVEVRDEVFEHFFEVANGLDSGGLGLIHRELLLCIRTPVCALGKYASPVRCIGVDSALDPTSSLSI